MTRQTRATLAGTAAVGAPLWFMAWAWIEWRDMRHALNAMQGDELAGVRSLAWTAYTARAVPWAATCFAVAVAATVAFVAWSREPANAG